MLISDTSGIVTQLTSLANRSAKLKVLKDIHNLNRRQRILSRFIQAIAAAFTQLHLPFIN